MKGGNRCICFLVALHLGGSIARGEIESQRRGLPRLRRGFLTSELQLLPEAPPLGRSWEAGLHLGDNAEGALPMGSESDGP